MTNQKLSIFKGKEIRKTIHKIQKVSTLLKTMPMKEGKLLVTQKKRLSLKQVKK